MARLKNMTKIYEWMYFDCWGMFVTFTMLVFLYILEIHCVIWGNINSISMQEVEIVSRKCLIYNKVSSRIDFIKTYLF